MSQQAAAHSQAINMAQMGLQGLHYVTHVCASSLTHVRGGSQ